MSCSWTDNDGHEPPSCLRQVLIPTIGGFAVACFWWGAPVVFGAIAAAAGRLVR